jgi:hypothetical protein
MNRELILKIRREAITKWVSNHNITVHKFSDEPNNIESLEIFAELIIKECLDACSRVNEIRNIVPPTQEQVCLWCMEEIENRFGVK